MQLAVLGATVWIPVHTLPLPIILNVYTNLTNTEHTVVSITAPRNLLYHSFTFHVNCHHCMLLCHHQTCLLLKIHNFLSLSLFFLFQLFREVDVENYVIILTIAANEHLTS